MKPLSNWDNFKNGYTFGEKTDYNSFHLGLDKLCPSGTQLLAPFDGTIIVAGAFPEGGNTIHFKPDCDDVVFRFMHLHSMNFKAGTHIKKGTVIGVTDHTGSLAGNSPHLHVDISKHAVNLKNNANFLDPDKYDFNKDIKPTSAPATFPIVIQVKLIANNAKWTTYAEKFAEIRQRILTASAGKLDLNIDVDYTSFDPKQIPFVGSPEYGDGSFKGVEMLWYNQNIAPHGTGSKKYHIVCFLIPYSAVPFNQAIYGICIGSSDGKLYRSQLFCDENATVGSSTITPMNLFVNSFIHENFGHALKEITGQNDDTHNFMYNFIPAKFDPAAFFATLDYQKLFDFIKNY